MVRFNQLVDRLPLLSQTHSSSPSPPASFSPLLRLRNPRSLPVPAAMASSSHSTPFAAPHGAPLSVDPYRDSAGFLPLVSCSKCGTQLIGRVSQQKGSKGKRFYKCPYLEHTDFACKTYMFEEQYVEYLVKEGTLPRGCSQIQGRQTMAMQVVHSGNDVVMGSHGFEACHELMQSVVIHLKGSEELLKLIDDKEKN